MQQGKPSATAWGVAVRRAVHQLLDQPLVLDDPLAVRIVGASAAEDAMARAAAADGMRRRFSNAMRAVVVARSRLAEDQLAGAVGQGLRQYVVLGAGLDTFAFRNLHAAAGLRVFEVDHPATQAWKQELLARAQIAAPAGLTFVAVDFETQSLAERLAASGFDETQPAFFSWLGVVLYLTLPAFRQTLAFLGQRPAGSHVVFDYAIGLEELTVRERIGFELLAQRVAAAGEPFKLFVPTAQIHAELRAAGFTWIEDLDASAVNARYFSERLDELKVAGRVGRFLHASKD